MSGSIRLLSVIINPNGVERISYVGFDVGVSYVTHPLRFKMLRRDGTEEYGHFALIHGKQPVRNIAEILHDNKEINTSPRLIGKNIFIYGTVIICRLIHGNFESFAETPETAKKLLDEWDVFYPIVNGIKKLRCIKYDIHLANDSLIIKFTEKSVNPEYSGTLIPVTGLTQNTDTTVITTRKNENISIRCDFVYVNKEKYIYNINFVPEHCASIDDAIAKVFVKAKKWLTVTRRNSGTKSAWINTYENIVDMAMSTNIDTFKTYCPNVDWKPIAYINVDTCEQYFDFNGLRIYSDGRGKYGDFITFTTPNFDGNFERLFGYMVNWKKSISMDLSKMTKIDVRFNCWRTNTRITVEESTFGSLYMNKNMTVK